ncbi:MAG: hypothetical protein DRQ88_05445 [Epsilonproteobacteria bacterium]|nr:MAG: hypothetical protein DRQ89_08460 [Campylobacterota bacterium]RLA66760.1 MAG: hypothetical protein DRQ88_05445 [Campylobacterota bacterium]
MSSLKDQLMKAGFKSTEKVKVKKTRFDNTRKKKTHSHHGHRTFCENCKGILPDVEFYDHRVPEVTGKWICTDCADKNWVPDETRKTAQSEAARRNIFKRNFGRTIKVAAKDSPR